MSTKYHGTQRAPTSSYAVCTFLNEKEELRFRNILDELRKHSIITDPKRTKEMMAEWKYSYQEEEEYEKCLCNKVIKYCHYVKHYLTGVVVGPLGSTCIEKFDQEMGAKAKAVQKAYVEAKAASTKAANAARWAVNIARVASAKAVSDEEKRKTSEAEWWMTSLAYLTDIPPCDAEWQAEQASVEAKAASAKAANAARWAVNIARVACDNANVRKAKSYESSDIRSFFGGGAVEDIGKRLVPKNFHAHQGKTLAQVWEHHRSYCDFVMRVGHVRDPVARKWFIDQQNMS
jgi:hypothetical protein